MTDYGSIKPQLKQQELTQAERDLLQADRPGYGTRHIIEVAFNLVNATVGAGIMGLPFAVSRAGFFTGVASSIWVAVLSQLGLYMLILAGKRVGIYKFAVLVEHVMGRFGYHFLNFVIVAQAGGACVSYFILLGDTIPVILHRYLPQFPLLSDRTFVIVAIGTLCILPLNLRRSIGSLARWSILSVLCLPIILLTILIRVPTYYDRTPHDDTGEPVFTWVGSDVFGALGIMAFAFTCSQVSFSNFLSLRNQSHRAWRTTTVLSTSISWAVSMTFAIVGYMCFGTKVQSNLFMNFDDDDAIVNIGRFALGFSMIFSIPMGFYPTREAIQKSLGFETATQQPTNFQHYTLTFVLFFFIMALGIAVRSLGIVYSLVGGFAATTLSYILPAATYLVTRWRVDDQPSPTLTAAQTLTVTPTISSKYYDDFKPPVFTPSFDAQSCSSSSRLLPSPAPNYYSSYYDEEDISTVDGGEIMQDDDSDCDQNSIMAAESLQRPSIRFLDVVAVILVVWGLVVMSSSVYGVLKDQQ